MQITTITFFTYQGFFNKIWAFGMMQFAHPELSKTKGLTFYKLMGSGKGLGFNPLPDWSMYCLLQVWESENDADVFFDASPLMKKYQRKTVNIWTLYLKNISAKGTWAGQSPFIIADNIDRNNSQLAILTRATIKWSKLRKFWTYVPTSQKGLSGNPGLIFTKGIGEVPLVQMATFSLWENKEAVHQYAYQSEAHSRAIKMTREIDWYKEELFARFQVFRTRGHRHH